MGFDSFFHSGGGRGCMVRLFGESDYEYGKRIAEQFYHIGQADAYHQAYMTVSRNSDKWDMQQKLHQMGIEAHDEYGRVVRRADALSDRRSKGIDPVPGKE